MSVKENISINTLDTVSSWCGISKRKETAKAEEIIKAYNVKTSNLNKEIKFLSGGNQQKVIIGRSTCTEPKILIFDEPTKGIDIGAKTEVCRLMKNWRKTDCDYINFFRNGRNKEMCQSYHMYVSRRGDGRKRLRFGKRGDFKGNSGNQNQ